MGNLQKLAEMAPLLVAATSKNPGTVQQTLGNMGAVRQQNYEDNLKAFGRELFGMGKTPDQQDIYNTAKKYDLKPADAMQVIKNFMAFKQQQRGDQVNVYKPMEGGGIVQDQMYETEVPPGYERGIPHPAKPLPPPKPDMVTAYSLLGKSGDYRTAEFPRGQIPQGWEMGKPSFRPPTTPRQPTPAFQTTDYGLLNKLTGDLQPYDKLGINPNAGKTGKPVNIGDWKHADKALTNRFSKMDPMGNVYIDKDLTNQHRLAQKKLAELKKQGDVGILEAVNIAEEYARNTESGFWSFWNDAQGDPEEQKKLINAFRRQYGYVPSSDKAKSGG